LQRHVHQNVFSDTTNDDWTNSKPLFIRSDWAPDTALIPTAFHALISHFLRQFQNKFKKRRVQTNLTPYQQKLLDNLQDSDNFIVLTTDKTFGRPSLNASIKDPFAYLYLSTAKVHKNPWKSWPVLSISGSITHGLGRWPDKGLKPICRKLPSFIPSSFDLKKS
jgi:hypothetical protein